MAKISTLTDDFSSGTINSGKWWSSNASISGGHLVLAPPNDTDVAYISSVDTYDLTDSSFFLQVISQYNEPLPFDLHIKLIDNSNGNSVGFYLYGNDINTSLNGLSVPSTRPIYVRISHSSANNLIYWDYSTDGASWTNVDSASPASCSLADLTQIGIVLQASDALGTGGLQLIIDNINTTGAAPSTPTNLFFF